MSKRIPEMPRTRLAWNTEEMAYFQEKIIIYIALATSSVWHTAKALGFEESHIHASLNGEAASETDTLRIGLVVCGKISGVYDHALCGKQVV